MSDNKRGKKNQNKSRRKENEQDFIVSKLNINQ